MNYKMKYDELIIRAIDRPIDTYTENHHIVPRCMGGTDDPDNLVRLTPEEHYVAHQLLVKIYPGNYALIRAATMMVPNRPSNKLYGWLRRKFAEAQSESQTGKKNSQYGTMWIYNNHLRKSQKIKKTDVIPDGWQKGRSEDKVKNCIVCKKEYESAYATCSKECGLLVRKGKKQKEAYTLLEQFIESDTDSLTKFSPIAGISQPGLTKMFRAHIIGYSEMVEHGKLTPKEGLKKLLTGP